MVPAGLAGLVFVAFVLGAAIFWAVVLRVMMAWASAVLMIFL